MADPDPDALTVRRAGPADLSAWAALRARLWPEEEPEQHGEEARLLLADDLQVAFLLDDGRGGCHGFLEGRLHAGPPPYAHVEGWFVAEDRRGRGHGRALVQAFEEWCLHRAIRRLTSDTSDAYPLSPGAHRAAGFREIATLRIFAKELGREGGGPGGADS